MRYYNKFSIAFVALALMLSGEVLAEDDKNRQQEPASVELAALNGDDDDDIEIVEVWTSAIQSYGSPITSSATKIPISTLKLPKNIAVVPSQVLEDQQVSDLRGALRNISGFTTNNTLGGTRDNSIFRGFAGSFDSPTYVNGFRSSSYSGYNAAVERIEVLKGPSSLLYGQVEPGGLINVITKQPQTTPDYKLKYTGDTDKATSKLLFDATGPLLSLGGGELLYRLVAEKDNSDYWRSFGDIDKTLLAPSLSYHAENTIVDLRYTYESRDMPFDTGTAFVDGEPLDRNPEQRLDDPIGGFEDENKNLELTVHRKLSADWAWHGQVSLQDFREEQIKIRPALLSTSPLSFLSDLLPQTGITEEPLEFIRLVDATDDRQTDRNFASAYVTGSVQAGGLQHEVLLGVDALNEKETAEISTSDQAYVPFQELYVFDLANPDRFVIEEGQSLTDHLVRDPDFVFDDRELGVYFQDLISWDEKLYIAFGGRYAQFDREMRRVGADDDITVVNDIHDATFLPRFGVVYRANEQWSLFASHTQSFAPSGVSTDPLVESRCPCDPEEGVSEEVGFKWNDYDVLLTVSLYQITKQNVLQTFTEEGSRIQDAIGEVESKGFELDVSGSLTDTTDFLASFAYTDNEIAENPQNVSLEGNSQRNVAPNTARLFVAQDLGRFLDGLSVGGGAHYIDSRPGDFRNSFNLGSYLLYDMFVRYRLAVGGGELDIQLNAENLTDEEYYYGARDANAMQVGRPRFARVSVAYAF